jgi:hypothetical protein
MRFFLNILGAQLCAPGALLEAPATAATLYLFYSQNANTFLRASYWALIGLESRFTFPEVPAAIPERPFHLEFPLANERDALDLRDAEVL